MPDGANIKSEIGNVTDNVSKSRKPINPIYKRKGEEQ